MVVELETLAQVHPPTKVMQRNEENDIATVRCFCFFVKEQTHAFYKLNLYFYSNYYILHLSDGLHFMHHFNFSSIISFSSIYIAKLAIVTVKQSTPFLPFVLIFFFQVSWMYFFFRRLFWQPSLSEGVTEANQSLGGCICYRPSVESSYLLGSFFFCTRFVNKYIGQFTFLRGWHRLATNWPLGERSEPFLAAKRPTEFYFSSRSRFVIIQLSYAETMHRIYEKTCSV